MSGKRTTHKILQVGFYWPTLFKLANAHVRRCDSCERFGGNPRSHDMPLKSILFIEPFKYWGVDYVRSIKDEKDPLRYIIVTVDYITKWPEAKVVKIVDAKSTFNGKGYFFVKSFSLL